MKLLKTSILTLVLTLAFHLPDAAGSAPVRATGMQWPDGQAFPSFAAPADTLDAIFYDSRLISPSEAVMLTTLQGHVNSRKPRIYMLNRRKGGLSEWADRIGINTRICKPADLYTLVAKYKKDCKGLVIYSTERSRHYVNLACTIAGLKGALAVTRNEARELERRGIRLRVLEDISALPYEKPEEIYTYLYEHYWADCTRRTMLSLNPMVSADIRDLATAVGAATIWLDPRVPAEREVLARFMSDLTPGKSVILGWWHDERSGIGICASYGLSTIPSDYYNNATVYAGGSHLISPAPVPKRKALENKVYVALFLSDGDNIQYCEHRLCRLWDNAERGTFPINWTVSPSLADLGPCMLNYYYATATVNDCLVSGPSGMGYALIYDQLNDIWHSSGREIIEPYTRLTQQYLRKSNLRVITIWDKVDEAQMDAYTDNCRHLYGITQEDWKRGPRLESYHRNGRLAFVPNRPCYTSYAEDMFAEWKDSIACHKGAAPAFFTAQGESWNMGPRQMGIFQSLCDSLRPGHVQICRADHFFSYYNEANGLDFNIMMLESAKAPDERLSDGSFSAQCCWSAAGPDDNVLTFDLGGEYLVDRYVLTQGSAAGYDADENIRSFVVSVSTDGVEWKEVDRVKDEQGDFIDHDITAQTARYMRFEMKSHPRKTPLRVAETEIWGKRINN